MGSSLVQPRDVSSHALSYVFSAEPHQYLWYQPAKTGLLHYWLCTLRVTSRLPTIASYDTMSRPAGKPTSRASRTFATSSSTHAINYSFEQLETFQARFGCKGISKLPSQPRPMDQAKHPSRNLPRVSRPISDSRLTATSSRQRRSNFSNCSQLSSESTSGTASRGCSHKGNGVIGHVPRRVLAGNGETTT